jgi:dTDP-4-amino-4,6-dideoxygalactose transaminase
MACFSFHPRKILTTGEGGMITTADSDMAARLRRLRQHAMTVSDVARHNASTVVIERYDEVGYNYRMTDLQAALGLGQLDRLDIMLSRRRSLADRYSEALSELSSVRIPAETAHGRHNYQSYMIGLVGASAFARDRLMQSLIDRGISSRRGVMAIHREALYRTVREWDDRLPVTNRVTDSTLILPLFHAMTASEQDHVIRCIEDHVAVASRAAAPGSAA